MTQSRWRELPNMISSQDGTDDRRPRAALRPWRPFCSAAGSPGATASPGAACATASASAACAAASRGATASLGAACADDSAAASADRGAARWFSRALSAATRGADAGSLDGGWGQEFRSAAGARDRSLLGSAVTGTEGTGGTGADGPAPARTGRGR